MMGLSYFVADLIAARCLADLIAGRCFVELMVPDFGLIEVELVAQQL
jgi:hypothetical protein